MARRRPAGPCRRQRGADARAGPGADGDLPSL
jgi:hypothetical protein